MHEGRAHQEDEIVLIVTTDRSTRGWRLLLPDATKNMTEIFSVDGKPVSDEHHLEYSYLTEMEASYRKIGPLAESNLSCLLDNARNNWRPRMIIEVPPGIHHLGAIYRFRSQSSRPYGHNQILVGSTTYTGKPIIVTIHTKPGRTYLLDRQGLRSSLEWYDITGTKYDLRLSK